MEGKTGVRWWSGAGDQVDAMQVPVVLPAAPCDEGPLYFWVWMSRGRGVQ